MQSLMFKVLPCLLVLGLLGSLVPVTRARELLETCAPQTYTYNYPYQYKDSYDLTGYSFPTCQGGYATITSGQMHSVVRADSTATTTYDCSSYTYSYASTYHSHFNTQGAKATDASGITYVVVDVQNSKDSSAGTYESTYSTTSSSGTSDYQYNGRLKVIGKGRVPDYTVAYSVKCSYEYANSYNYETGVYDYHYSQKCQKPYSSTAECT